MSGPNLNYESVVETYILKNKISSEGLLAHLVKVSEKSTEMTPAQLFEAEMEHIFKALCIDANIKAERVGATLDAIGFLQQYATLAQVKIDWPTMMRELASCVVQHKKDKTYSPDKSPSIMSLLSDSDYPLKRNGFVHNSDLVILAMKRYFPEFDINAEVGHSGETILANLFAYNAGNLPQIDFMLSVGADPHITYPNNDNGVNCLHRLNPMDSNAISKYRMLINLGLDPTEIAPFKITSMVYDEIGFNFQWGDEAAQPDAQTIPKEFNSYLDLLEYLASSSIPKHHPNILEMRDIGVKLKNSKIAISELSNDKPRARMGGL